MTAQVCTPEGEHCYDCSDYAGAFACLDKIRISDMAVTTQLELSAAIESECESVLIAADFVPCNGDPYTQAIDVSNLISAAAVTSPIGATFWTPIDFGDSYGNCWKKFNKDLTITRVDFPDFFTVAGLTGDVFTVSGMEGKMAMGSGDNYCNNNAVTGDSDNKFKIGTENLPKFTIDINDPGHAHSIKFPLERDAEEGNDSNSYDSAIPPDGTKTFDSNANKTGITATPRVGSGGNGSAVAISVRPWSVCGSWYIKLSNDCA